MALTREKTDKAAIKAVEVAAVPEEKKSDSQARKNLRPEDLEALKNLKKYYKTETEKCVKLTSNTTLTAEEYNHATPEFKNLIEIPYKKNEPIYIMPEFNDKKNRHPELTALVEKIKSGKPYHTFINKSLGMTWPLLLRLYYGLSSGFKISIEQFHSMLKVCYWHELKKLEVESVPFFENDYGDMSEAAEQLLKMLYFPNPDIQIDSFKDAMKDSKTPKGERYLQVVKLDVDYFHAAMLALEAISVENNDGLAMMSMYDQILFGRQGKYSYASSAEFVSKAGAQMFCAPIAIGVGHYKVNFLQNKPCLIIPSSTMQKKYYDILNPGRNLKIVNKLGIYGPDTMEKLSDQNARPVNLYAPGISNPLISHRKIIPPAFGLEHDDYHITFEALLTKSLYLQMTRGKNIFRKLLGNETVYSAEITRFLDREKTHEVSDDVRFFELLRYVFCIDPNEDQKVLRLSSVIILTDMILSPAEWPFYSKLKNKLIDLFLHNKTEKKSDFVNTVEKTTRAYAAATNNNLSLTAILLLCHFYLKDASFCKILLELHLKNPAALSGAWRKMPHGHLFPVLILNGKDYALEKLSGLSPQVRTSLWMQAKVAAPEVKEESVIKTKESSLNAGEIVISIPDFDDEKRKLILVNMGRIVRVLENKIAEVKIESALLKKTLRELLGIDRVLLLGRERSDYLKAKGMVIEATGSPDKFQVTFMKDQRALVEKVAKHWEAIVAEQKTTFRP
jgi:hypothetical protein